MVITDSIYKFFLVHRDLKASNSFIDLDGHIPMTTYGSLYSKFPLHFSWINP